MSESAMYEKITLELLRQDVYSLRHALALAHAEMQKRIKRYQKQGKFYASELMEAGDYGRLFFQLKKELDK